MEAGWTKLRLRIVLCSMICFLYSPRMNRERESEIEREVCIQEM